MKCKYEGTGIYEGRCYGTKEIDPCPGYDKCSQFKPNFKTNADHIRSMSDVELATELIWIQQDAYTLGDRMRSIDNSKYPLSKEKWLEWLAEPHKEKEE